MAKNALLLNFREKDSTLGISRAKLRKIAQRLGTTETGAVHIAIARLYINLFENAGNFDFPNKKGLARRDRSTENHGKVVKTRGITDLF